LETLRDRRESIPVVMITGRGDPVLKARLVEAGALAVFDKPVEAEDLVEAVETAFRHSTWAPRT
jgi:two-component system response regulator FixJ